MGLIGRGRNFSAVEIDSQCFISLISKFRGLFLYPVVQPPPFVDDNDARERTFTARCVRHALHRFVTAFVRDRRASSRKSGDGKNKREDQQKNSQIALPLKDG